jgi:dienelactone hydrolase
MKNESELKSLVDWSTPVGVLGYSMGGVATHITATNESKIKEFNIGAAVALHPVHSDEEPINLPIFYAAGSKDKTTPAKFIKQMYKAVPDKQPTAFANLLGGIHGEPYLKARWNPYIVSFFNCHLLKIDVDCK